MELTKESVTEEELALLAVLRANRAPAQHQSAAPSPSARVRSHSPPKTRRESGPPSHGDRSRSRDRPSESRKEAATWPTWRPQERPRSLEDWTGRRSSPPRTAHQEMWPHYGPGEYIGRSEEREGGRTRPPVSKVSAIKAPTGSPPGSGERISQASGRCVGGRIGTSPLSNREESHLQSRPGPTSLPVPNLHWRRLSGDHSRQWRAR
jgi:hypothetical protein